MRAVAIALAISLASVLAVFLHAPTEPTTWAASPKERRFASAKHGVGAEAPPGWSLSLHTGYPSIIALMLHPNGSRISISVSEYTATTARDLSERNRRGLAAQRLTVTNVSETSRDGIAVDAQAQARGEMVRQIYLVRALTSSRRQAIILTLTARADVMATATSSLDLLFARLSLETPTAISPDAGAEIARRDGGSAL